MIEENLFEFAKPNFSCPEMSNERRISYEVEEELMGTSLCMFSDMISPLKEVMPTSQEINLESEHNPSHRLLNPES